MRSVRELPSAMEPGGGGTAGLSALSHVCPLQRDGPGHMGTQAGPAARPSTAQLPPPQPSVGSVFLPCFPCPAKLQV